MADPTYRGTEDVTQGSKPGPAPSLISDAASGGGYGSTTPSLPGTKTSTPTTQAPGPYSVLDPSQINNLATSEVDTAIAGQTDPLTADIATYTSQQQRAQDAIKDMFGNILPYVQGSAADVQNAYAASLGAENNIMQAAQQRLNQLKQQRAQDAQTMAQQIGGPVALGEFTAGLDDQGTLLANLSAGQLLHTLGYAQAGTQQAQAFAGQVFPLLQTEQQATSRAHFDDLIKNAQDQIDKIKAQRGDMVNQKVADLTQQERTYALQVAQQKLDTLKANRDWAATKATLKNDTARLSLSQQTFKTQQQASQASTALAKQRLTQQDKQFQQSMNLSNEQMAERKAELAASTKLSSQKLAAANRQEWAGWLDAALNPTPGKAVTTTTAVPSTYQMALKDPKNSYQGNDGKWYHIIKTTQTPTTQAIHGPNNLVDYLVSHQVPKTVAIKMVRAQLHIPNWNYGDKPKGPPQRQGPPNPPRTQPGPYGG